jgi:hypothetical protein
MPYQASAISSAARIEALKARHRQLSDSIESEQSRFFLGDHDIARMKKEKLMLKEQIEGIAS